MDIPKFISLATIGAGLCGLSFTLWGATAAFAALLLVGLVLLWGAS